MGDWERGCRVTREVMEQSSGVRSQFPWDAGVHGGLFLIAFFHKRSKELMGSWIQDTDTFGKGPNDIECGRIWQHHSGITGLICQSSLGEVLELRVTVEKQSLKRGRENAGKCKAQPSGLMSKTLFLGGQGIFQIGNCH